MKIHGQLGVYDVIYARQGISFAVIRVRQQARKWYGVKYWKVLKEIDEDELLEKFERMYPGEMLHLFTEAVKNYEDYIIKWRAFEAIHESGAKLEVNDE